ncbi:50S ribosomal protein L35 [candidate division WWE3 bacterium]|nr:50S ribosomal protein L35 [candidate division WWE3 bacterium]
MPKLKTKKTLKKRVKITGSGKVMVGHGRNGHLKRKESANQKNRKKGYKEYKDNAFKKKLKKLLGKKGANISIK